MNQTITIRIVKNKSNTASITKYKSIATSIVIFKKYCNKCCNILKYHNTYCPPPKIRSKYYNIHCLRTNLLQHYAILSDQPLIPTELTPLKYDRYHPNLMV